MLNYILLFLFAVAIPTQNLQQFEKPVHTFDDLFPLSDEEFSWIDSTLSSLSLREKCAQLIFPYANGKDTLEYPDGYKRITKLVEEENIGGVLFLTGDIQNQTEIINRLQAKSKVPLMITLDMERGVGMRLEDGVEFPYKMAFAAAGNPKYDYKMAVIAGKEGRALGVHQNFAPLLDVVHDYRNPIINVRAYSSNPDIIAVHSDAFINGMHDANMITTAKHFPGHGATDLDSHNELPLIELTKSELWSTDLKPFQFAINSGVKSVMIGHLDVPEITNEENLPATFSYEVVTKLLRNEMGFNGIIVTDALNMHALTKSYTQKEIGVLSLKAGNDILLFPSDEVAMIDGLVEAVSEGKISEDRIDESVKKILQVKKWLGLDKTKFIDKKEAEKIINKRSHFRLAEEVAEKSITLVKDEQNIIPLNPDDYSKVYSITISDSRINKVIEEPFLFEKILNEKFGYVKNFRVNFNTKGKEYSKILTESEKADLIILSIYANVKSFTGKIDLHQEQFDFIDDLLELEIPSIAISFGNPFILSEVSEIPTYLTTYGNVNASQTAAINSLLGNIPIKGKLPVDLPNTNFEIGDGLEVNPNELFYQISDSNYNFSQIDSIMNYGIENKVFPGAALVIGHRERVVYDKYFGNQTYSSESKEIDDRSIFDLASLTKVVATTSAAMMLYEEDELDLEEYVIEYLPDFDNNEKDKVKIKHLLLHNSGLPAWKPFYKNLSDSAEVIKAIMEMELDFKPGTQYQYSDIGMIVLQKVIESITGMGLDDYIEENLFSKLEMNSTFYNPSPKVWYHCVPTEKDNYWRNQLLKGRVHDETAFLLNGVSGHAGLFSTADDLAKLMYVYLNEGMYKENQIFKPATIELFTSKNSELSSRALGWDTKSEEGSSAGELFDNELSFGHTGFTGTSIWVDKREGLFVILLTNRVHPTRENREIINFRPLLHDAIYRSLAE